MTNLPSKNELTDLSICKNAIGLSHSDLEKINNAPAEFKYFLQARYKSPRLIDFKENSGKNKVGEIILNLFALSQYKIKDEKGNPLIDIGYVRDNFYSQLIKKYPTITIQEIKEATQSGLNGEYNEITGKLFGINVANLMSWVIEYIRCNKRKEAINHVFKVERNEVPVDKEIVKRGFSKLSETINAIVSAEEKAKKERAESLLLKNKSNIKYYSRDLFLIEMFDRIQSRQNTQLENGTRYITIKGHKMQCYDFQVYMMNRDTAKKELKK